MTYEHSELISNAVGCGQTDSHAKKACLKALDYHRFWEVRKELNLTDISPNRIDALFWTPNFDDDFFQGKTLDELQRAAPKRKILYGTDFDETLFYTLITQNPITSKYATARGGFVFANRSSATAEDVRKLCLQYLTDPQFNATTKDAIIDRIFEFYQVGMGPNATDPIHYFYKLTDILGATIKSAIGAEIQAKYEMGWRDQYMYQFNYVRPQDRGLIGNGPGHGYVFLYLFALNIYTTNGISNTTEDNLVQKNVAQVFYNFIKGETPSANGISIPKATANSIPYMLVNTGVSIETTNIKPGADFWNQLAADYHYDFLQQINI